MITRKPPRVGGSKYCVQNKRFVNRQDVLVTEDGKLQNVIVYVRSGYEGRSYTAPTEPVLLDQQHCVYVPHVFTIMTNQKVTVRNSDDTFHNVPAMPMTNPVVNRAQPMMGMQNTVTFAYREMPFRIGCDLHGWMGDRAGRARFDGILLVHFVTSAPIDHAFPRVPWREGRAAFYSIFNLAPCRS